jgi:hypothetical protein
LVTLLLLFVCHAANSGLLTYNPEPEQAFLIASSGFMSQANADSARKGLPLHSDGVGVHWPLL